ncbi:hypothetical protein GJ496_009707 [Pomphorhynchus laevis]|nr:hypothetical protein GJ496_009707 [Pomphorhynchus laevis]
MCIRTHLILMTLQKRISLWKENICTEFFNETNFPQKSENLRCTSQREFDRKHKYLSIMTNGKVTAANRLLSNNSVQGVLSHDTQIDGVPVSTVLRDLHPPSKGIV